MHDAWVQRRTFLVAEPVWMVSLQEHVRIAHVSASAGAVKVELGRAFAARGVYVEEGQRRQVRQRHEQDIRAVRYYSQYSTETVVGRVWQGKM